MITKELIICSLQIKSLITKLISLNSVVLFYCSYKQRIPLKIVFDSSFIIKIVLVSNIFHFSNVEGAEASNMQSSTTSGDPDMTKS